MSRSYWHVYTREEYEALREARMADQSENLFYDEGPNEFRWGFEHVLFIDPATCPHDEADELPQKDTDGGTIYRCARCGEKWNAGVDG